MRKTKNIKATKATKTTKRAYKDTLKQRKIISDNQKVYKIVSRIYKELRSNPQISFKRLRGCCGLYDMGDEHITIDYRREVLPTLIHEFIHKLYPDKSETWVLHKERFVMSRISPAQAKRLLILLSNIV